MEAPKCKLCGKREWRHVCVVSDGTAQIPRTLARAVPQQPPARHVEVPKVRQGRKLDSDKPAERTKGRLDASGSGNKVSGFDRNAYQREYMRNRRAKMKDAK